MPVTKYDLSILANSFFIATRTQPRHPVTPDAVHAFCANVFGIIAGILQQTRKPIDLYNYIISVCNYYGIDLKKANEFLNKIPGMQKVFIEYTKDNFRLETNNEILTRVVKDSFSFVANLAAGAIWAILKPLLPIIGVGIGVIYLTNRATTKKQSHEN